MRRPFTRLLAVLLAGAIVSPPAAWAHNQKVHQDMVTVAYEIMRLSVVNPHLFAAPVSLPPGVTMADWNRFRNDVNSATLRLPELQFDTDYKGRSCRRWPRLKDVDRVPKTDFLTGNGCPVSTQGWEPRGIYNANNLQARVDMTSGTLGFLASNVDNEFDDSHLSLLPRNSAVVGPIADAVDFALDLGIAAALLPLVCALMWIKGDPSCLSALADIADAVNPIDEIVDSISVGDSTGEDWVGIWHHIDVRTSGVSNEFDDHQGFFLEETGYRGEPDIVEHALQIALDVEGLSLDPNTSRGLRFEQATAADFSQNTRSRSWSQWQGTTIVHTPTLPLDNLALWGWSTFRANHGQKAAGLGWPLHALGDAVAPMHTIGSPAWGHRPFEIAVEQIWDEIRLVNDPAAEQQQAQRIFAEAARFRKVILDWRQSHPQAAKDELPIRDLITLVAQETLAYADQKMATDGWPFKRYASIVFHGTSKFESFPLIHVPGEDEAIALYAENGGAGLVRPLIEKGAGAMIAFLTSAAEVR